jgi:hypothetical protein
VAVNPFVAMAHTVALLVGVHAHMFDRRELRLVLVFWSISVLTIRHGARYSRVSSALALVSLATASCAAALDWPVLLGQGAAAVAIFGCGLAIESRALDRRGVPKVEFRWTDWATW